MNDEQLKQLEGVIDGVMKQNLGQVLPPMVAEAVHGIVAKMRLDRAITGRDVSGLSDEHKKDLAGMVAAFAYGKPFTSTNKSGEALISQDDGRGGLLIPTEVSNAILRVAASVGLVLSQATRWPMTGDKLEIPSYRGSFLEGEYLGYDSAGSVTGLSFKATKLIVETWQLAFVLSNDLIADAGVALGDWLLALAGEALANMIDKQAFVGTKPFVGLLNNSDVAAATMTAGKTGFKDFDLDEASDVIGSLEESLLDGAAFYMHRTVWAKVRVKKDGAGAYILPQAGAASAAVLSHAVGGGGLKPAGEILGYPVFTNRHFPALADTAVSTKFAIFGNLRALAFGDKGGMTVEDFKSGSFGGKEIGLANQKALVMKHRNGVATPLPAAFTAVKTPAS